MSHENAKKESTVLDRIRNFFGEDVSPDLIVGIDKMDADQLQSFGKLIRRAEREVTLPTKQPGELRPYLTYQILEDIRAQTGVQLSTNLAFSDDNFLHGPMADLVKRNLLYCHSLTLFDPLPYIADLLPLGESRVQLRNYLSWLNELKPLVEDGILTFVSDLAYKPQPGVIITESRVLPIDVQQKLESLILRSELFTRVFGTAPDRAATFVAGWFIAHAEDSLWEMTHASARFPQTLDYYLAWPFYTEIMREYLAHHDRELKQTAGHSLALQSLMSINIPNLDALSIDDVCRIRSNEASFERWRNDLRQALLYAHSQQVAMIEPYSEQTAMVNEELRQRSRDLCNNLTKNRWIAKTKAGVKGFTIGSVAAITKAMTVGGDVETAIITPFVSALLSMLWPDSSISKSYGAAELQHYLAFDQAQET